MARVGLGVVGCGDVAARLYLPTIAKISDRSALIAVCDTASGRAEQAKQKYNAWRSYTSLDGLLADPDVEAVVNLTDVEQHAAVGLQTLRAGKHLHQEKPLASTMEDANALVAEAEKRGLLLVCAPATSLLAARRYVRALVKGGAIGRVAFALGHASGSGPALWEEYTSDPSWFYGKDVGPLIDSGVYAVDYLVDVLGPARRVTGFAGTARPDLVATAAGARGKRIEVEGPDNMLLLADFGDATFAAIDASFCAAAPRGPAVELFGDEGTIVVYEPWDDRNPEICRDDGAGWQCLEIPAEYTSRPDLSYAAGVEHLIDCILAKSRPTLSGYRGRHVLEIMLAFQRASEEGRTVDVLTTDTG